MKDKILALCRRLKKCSLDDLSTLLEIDDITIKSILYQLENSKQIQQKNNIIIYLGNQTVSNGRIEKKSVSYLLQYRSEKEKEIIIKGFCLEIPPHKLCELLNLQKNCVCQYYAILRKMIYDIQHKNLIKYYSEDPQLGRYRIFYDKYAYFYVYKNNVFVSENLLKTNKSEKPFTKSEVREFKVAYSFLRRVESHNVNENYMYYRLAEYIWRREKNYEQLFSEITHILKIA